MTVTVAVTDRRCLRARARSTQTGLPPTCTSLPKASRKRTVMVDVVPASIVVGLAVICVLAADAPAAVTTMLAVAGIAVPLTVARTTAVPMAVKRSIAV
ncbi:MAG: hypothetical protein ACT4O1_02015 [Gemmatimonadota bacterium]